VTRGSGRSCRRYRAPHQPLLRRTRSEVYGADRRVVLTHSATLHTAQSRGFDQTVA
jgi:hypothetical protein